MSDTFKQKTAAPDGDYLWSYATNWSTGIAPIDGDSVSSALAGYDDIAGLGLASLTLTLGGDVSVIAPALDVATASGVNGSILGADAYDAGAPVTVTVDSITGSGAIYLASGAGAVLRDESATDLGENFYAANDGLIELSATPASTSELIYDGGVAAFALKDPDASNAVKIFYLGQGDVLELPGTSVTGATFGTDSLSVTTNDGTYAFTDVTYATGMTVEGYTAAYDSTTGLEAITFTVATVFKQTTADDGRYLWSNATNWSTSLAPIDGDSVSSALQGYDDIAGLSLASLALTLGGDVSVIAPTLDVATVSGVNGSILGADAYDAGAPVTVTVGSITGSGAIYLASGAGAVLRDESATDLGENFYAANGGLIELSATPASTSELIYDGGVAAFALKDPGATNAVKIFYLGRGDVLELPGTSVTHVTFGTDSLSVTTNDGSYAFTDVTYATGTPVSSYSAAFDDTTGLEAITFLACYARGTRIATPSGNRPIEDLVAGDLVQARFAGTVPVRWVGRRHLDCRRHVDPGTVWPVRIAAGAFGDNLPVRDLYLSPDHAVFIDDVLVPVRQLINGVSIAPQAVDQITYFHIELDRHDVVLAEELPAETYLDTGHRAAFDNAGLPMRLHPTFVTAAATDRAPGCCAPLAVAPDRVEPIWRRLAARAGSPAGRPDATTDPHLRLACAGRATRPLLAADSRYIFALPPGQDCVRIASRAAAPTDLRPWLDDRRRLGVAVSRIVLRGRHDVIDLPVDHPALVDGWHPPETDGARRWRWTDGNAALPLPPGTRVMELHLAGSMHYPVGKRQPPCTVLPVFYISDICSA